MSDLAKNSRSTFSDNVVCVRHRSGRADEKRKKFLVKDGVMRLLFMDALGGPKVVADVTITRSQAYNLMDLLSTNLKAMDKELEEMKPADMGRKKDAETAATGSYVG